MPLQSSGEIRLSQIAAELGVTQGEFRLGNFITTAEFPGRRGMKRFHGYTFSTALFEFSSFTFTPCGATGKNGPTSGQCTTTYGSQVWHPTYFSVSSGIQTWTVPSTGTYRLTLAGAKGGINGNNTLTGGSGAKFRIDVDLEESDELNIVIGQEGVQGPAGRGGGGGGGTFVYIGSIGGTGLIAAAGGGGGADDSNPNGQDCRSDLNPTNRSGTAIDNDGQAGSSSQGNGTGWLSSAVGTRAGSRFTGGTGAYGGDGGFGGGGGEADDGASGAGFTGGDDSFGAGSGGSYYAGLTVPGGYTSDYANDVSNFAWISTNAGDGSLTIEAL